MSLEETPQSPSEYYFTEHFAIDENSDKSIDLYLFG
jgi:hypothetical protein